MQANWNEKYLNQVGYISHVNAGERYLTQGRRPTEVRCLTSYKQLLGSELFNLFCLILFGSDYNLIWQGALLDFE